MCLEDVHRILAPEGECMLQFPISHGIGNTLRALPGRPEENDYDSWCVRYYAAAELKEIFSRYFDHCRLRTDCYFGIGLQRSDLDILPLKYKTVVILSEVLKLLSAVVRPLQRWADSVYVVARKTATKQTMWSTGQVRCSPARGSNLDVIQYLQCPLTGGELELSAECRELVSRMAGLAYPVVNEIPVLIPEHSRPL